MFCNDSAESKLMASTGYWDCDREREREREREAAGGEVNPRWHF